MSFRYRGAIRSGTAASYSLSTASGIWTKQTELQAANSNLWPLALGVPGTPSIATAAALTATSATIQIIAPTLNGNSAITQYIATAIPIVNGPSISVISPVITGTSIVGEVLNCSLGTWVTTTTPTYSYQWKRGASNIGSNSNTYTIVSNDRGTNITCIVTVTTIIDSISATSNSILITIIVPSVTAVGTVTKTSNAVISIPFTAPTDNGGATVTSYSIVSSPSIALTYNGTTSPISVTGSFVAEQAYTFTIAAINSAGTGTVSGSSNSIVAMTLIGQALFTTAGSYTWTAPPGITSVSVVCVGSGGGGFLLFTNTDSNVVVNGGAGGGLGYTNNISVTPNNNYTVVVGAARGYGFYVISSGSTSPAGQGQYSYFADNTGVINATSMVIGSKYAIVSLGTTTFTSYGALANLTNCVFTATGVGIGTGTVVKIEVGGGGGNGGSWDATSKSSFVGDGGGWGGGTNPVNNPAGNSTTGPTGGGGAGGYYNNGTVSGGFGGASNYVMPYVGPTASYNNSGGGGGWGMGGSRGGGGSAFGGGGVGIYGHVSGGGYAGSSGPGSGGSNGDSGGSYVNSGNHDGGAYGGGGAGGNTTASGAGYSGRGAVRIVWGTGRSFPSTNVNTDI